jgi:hypothetical protein
MTTTYLPNKYSGYPAIGDGGPGWGNAQTATVVNIDAAFGGNQAFALGSASGTISVTGNVYVGAYPANTPSYVPLSWTLTGTLTASVTLQIPAGVGGQWLINNQCTMGAYTITVAAASGVTSATLSTGVQAIYSDGLGNINLTTQSVSGYAPLASPAFTGVPTAPTASPGTNSTQLATTAFVTASFLTTATASATYAPIASPTFTGSPAAPTAIAGTNTTQIATTAFVTTAVSGATSASKWFITGGIPTAMSGTNTTASITISACSCADATGTSSLSYAGGTVTTGTGINTLGVATLANSTTYHVYICVGGSGTGIYASTTYGMGAASAPSGYQSYVRRIFSFLTTSAGAPQAFTADEIAGGSYVAYLSTPTLDVNAATASTASRTLYTMSVPQGPKMQWQGRLAQSSGLVANYTSPDELDLAPSITAAPLSDTNVYSMSLGRTIMTNGSGQIGVRGANAATFSLSTLGWIDMRRS